MLSRKINLNTSWLRQLALIWQRLTAPHPSLQEPEQRRQAQLLASSALLILPLGFVAGLVPILFNTPARNLHLSTFMMTASSVALCVPAYLLARTRIYKVGVIIVIVVVSTAIYISVPITESLIENPLHYLIVPILLCNLFFPPRATAALIFTFATALLLLPTIVPSVSMADLVIGPVRFVLLISMLLLMFALYRRQVESDRRAALTQSEHRYRIVSELTSDFTYSLNIDAEGQVTPDWVSGDFAALTGGEVFQTLTPHNWMSFVHADDLAIVGQSIVDIAAGKTVEGELRFIGETGNMRWIHFYARPEWNEGEERVTHIYGAAKDVSDRKATEMAERDQRNLAEALRDTAAILNSTLEPETVLNQILANVARVVPHDAGSIMMIENGSCRIVRHNDIIQHPNEQEIYDLRLSVKDTPTLSQMYATQRPLLIPNVTTFDGWIEIEAHRWINAFLGTPICIADEVVGFLTLDSSTANGFTPQHAERLEVFANQASIAIRNARLYEALSNEAAELDRRVVNRTAELDRERRQLRAILDAMGEGMFYTEGQTIVYTNPALSQITGYRPEDMNGQTPHLFGLPSHEDTHLNNGRIWRDERRIYGQNGKMIDSAITVTMASEPEEVPPRAVAVVRDIGQEKALQVQKRQFVAIASHELRTPLTNMNTRLYLIRHQPERTEEHLRVIEDVVKDMQALTEDLLDLARFENRKVTLTLHPAVLQEVIRSVIALQEAMWQTKRVHLTLDLPDAPIHVMADGRRLRQVMTNLVSNAFNYTLEDGYVTIQLTAETEWAIICVTDSGIGIESKHLQDLFEPFFRVREDTKGTGLGLTITREIVQLHGGEISVESEPQHGSRFTVRLPLVAK